MSTATLRYAVLNAFFWSAFCLAVAFSSVFLLARGLSNAQIGLVLAVSGALSAALQPLVAHRAGLSRRPLRTWIAWLAVLVAACAAASLPHVSALVTAIVFGLAICVVQIIVPLLNALGMESAAHGDPVAYGPARAVGSFSFALTSLGAGALVAVTGAVAIPALLIVTQALLVVAALTYAIARPGRSLATDATPVGVPDLPELDAVRRRRFWLLIAGVTALYFSHATINSFMFQVVTHFGGAASDMGVAFTIAACLETLPMIFFGRLVARWRPGTLLRVSAVVFALKSLLTWQAGSLPVFYLAQCLQIGAFALIVPASVYYVDRLLPVRARVQGQAYMTMALTVANVLAGLVGGPLLDAVGVPALLLAGTVVACAGVAAVVAGTESV